MLRRAICHFFIFVPKHPGFRESTGDNGENGGDDLPAASLVPPQCEGDWSDFHQRHFSIGLHHGFDSSKPIHMYSHSGKNAREKTTLCCGLWVSAQSKGAQVRSGAPRLRSSRFHSRDGLVQSMNNERDFMKCLFFAARIATAIIPALLVCFISSVLSCSPLSPGEDKPLTIWIETSIIFLVFFFGMPVLARMTDRWCKPKSSSVRERFLLILLIAVGAIAGIVVLPNILYAPHFARL